MAEEIWLDNHMTGGSHEGFPQNLPMAGRRREKPLLSDREKEIVQLVAQGYRNKKLRKALYQRADCQDHLHNIFDKLGVPTARTCPIRHPPSPDRSGVAPFQQLIPRIFSNLPPVPCSHLLS